MPPRPRQEFTPARPPKSYLPPRLQQEPQAPRRPRPDLYADSEIDTIPEIIIPGEPKRGPGIPEDENGLPYDPDESDSLVDKGRGVLRDRAKEFAIDKATGFLGINPTIAHAFFGVGGPVGLAVMFGAWYLRRKKPLRSALKRGINRRRERRRARRGGYDGDYEDGHDIYDGNHPDHEEHVTDGYEVVEKKIRLKRPVRTIVQRGMARPVGRDKQLANGKREVTGKRNYNYRGTPAHFFDDETKQHWN